MNENRLLIFGAENINCDAMKLVYARTIEADIANLEPTPQAVLQRREEWEFQSVTTHDVPASDKRKDADALPYMPSTNSIEFPVEAAMLDKALLTDGAMLRFKLDIVALMLRKETWREKVPIKCDIRKKIVESDAQTVDSDADI